MPVCALKLGISEDEFSNRFLFSRCRLLVTSFIHGLDYFFVTANGNRTNCFANSGFRRIRCSRSCVTAARYCQFCRWKPVNSRSVYQLLLHPVGRNADSEKRKKSRCNVYLLLVNVQDEEVACEKNVVSPRIRGRLEGGNGIGGDNDRDDDDDENNYYNSNLREDRVASATYPLTDTTSNNNDEFCVVVSMRDGLVLHATSSLKKALGYSRDEWIGRSFVDFVNPKDKPRLTHEITKNIAIPYGDTAATGFNGRQTTSLFCSLRKRTATATTTATAASSFSSSSSSPTYLPFYLTMNIKYFKEQTDTDRKPLIFLTISAEPVRSAYKAPEEMIISSIFSTRHDPKCVLVHVDYNVTQYFGYLPQDMIGHSLFEFYHPEDLPFIKEIYETVSIHERRRKYRSSWAAAAALSGRGGADDSRRRRRASRNETKFIRDQTLYGEQLGLFFFARPMSNFE